MIAVAFAVALTSVVATAMESSKRMPDGRQWTSSESGPANAWFYNFGKGRPAVYRQQAGEKERAFSVRCVKE